MTGILVDTSVALKWFHAEGEDQVAESRALLNAHAASVLDARVIDLALYELGNVLIRGLGWSARDAADQLDDLMEIVGTPLALSPSVLRRSAELAAAHRLSFYDAAWAAAAEDLEVTLVSADRRLQDAGLAESPRAAVERLRLPWPRS